MQSLRAYNLSPKQSSAAKRKKLTANPSGLSRKHESKPTSPTTVIFIPKETSRSSFILRKPMHSAIRRN